MSLFCTYDWWSTQCTKKKENEGCHKEKENTDFRAESLYLVDLKKDGPQILLVSSLSGTLWAFKPTSANSSQDLLFEYNFGKPILALGSGNLLLGSQEKHLAVLHPTKLNVYSFHQSFGNAAHGQQFYLEPVYSISFEFLAYNFLIGPFGSVVCKSAEKLERDKNIWQKSSQDSICVQSIDGYLHFYENDLNFLCPPNKNTLKNSLSMKQSVSSQDFQPSNQRQQGNVGFCNTKKMENSVDVTRADVHSFPADHDSSVDQKISDDENETINLCKTDCKLLEEEGEEDVQLLKNQAKLSDNYECAIQISKPKFTVAPLEDIVLPTLFCYMPPEDCFIIFSGSWLINCYRYTNLEIQQIGHRKKKAILPEWTYILGEPIFYLSYLDGYIFALGTRGNLVALNQYGLARFFIKLCFCPSAFHPYTSDGKIMFLAVSEERTLMVYDGGPAQPNTNDPKLYPLQSAISPCIGRLVWSAKLPLTPIAISTGRFEELCGLVVILSDQGYVHCCHLGTTPRNFMEMPRENMKFDQEDEELDDKMVQPAIEGNTLNSNLLKVEEEMDLFLELVLNSVNLSPYNSYAEGVIHSEGNLDEECISTNHPTVEIDITLILSPVTPLNNVCISASVDKPFLVSFRRNFITRLSEETKIPLQVTAHYYESLIHNSMPNLRMEVSVSGFGSSNETTERLSLQVYHTCYMLPLSAVFSIKQSLYMEATEVSKQEKKLEFMFQGQECPFLNALFPEFKFTSIDSKSSKLDLFLYGDNHKRIQVAMEYNDDSCKSETNECMYLISSSCIFLLYYLTTILVERIESYISTLGSHLAASGGIRKGNFYQLNLLSPLPLNELLEAVDNHYLARLQVIKLNHSLDISRKQLHLAECSILSKVRDVTPKPAIFSETLLEELFEKVINGINALECAQKELNFKKEELGTLMHMIVKLQPELSSNPNFKSFEQVISTDMLEVLQQGWEERTEAGLDYLLKRPHKSNLEQLNVDSNDSEEQSVLQTHSLKAEIADLLQKFINDETSINTIKLL